MLDRRTRTFLDVAVAVWTVIWILVGSAVYREVLALRSLSGTVVVAGDSLHRTASTLRAYGAVPFVGANLARIADDADRTARSARASGRQSRGDIEDLARLLALAVSAVAILPAALAWSLLRFRRPVRAP